MPNQLPYVIQGSEAPAFRGFLECDAKFYCQSCAYVLIENYASEDFVGVGIQCFRCKTISWTPTDLKGEIFSASVVTLGETGRFLLMSTVQTRPNVMLTCDASYAAAIAALHPRDGAAMELSESALDEAVAAYDRISPGAFTLQDKILARNGNADPLRFPFTWAVRHLRVALQAGEIDLSNFEVRTAFMWIQFFTDMVVSWQHHPRFAVIARDLAKPDSFIHTVFLLIITKYLFNFGNPIGFSLEDAVNQSNPDLYMRSASGHVHIEVKARRELQCSHQAPTDLGFLKGAVGRAIDSSKKQIGRGRKGALVIVSTFGDEASPEALRCHAQAWLEAHGQNRTSLACVAVAAATNINFRRTGNHISQPTEVSFLPVLNPHFRGANPFNTKPLARPT